MRKGLNMNIEQFDIECIRKMLLDDLYAGAFAGMSAMLTEAEEVKHADYEELIQIAERYGLL